MDVLDLLNDRTICGLCGRLVPYSEDFCSSCRKVAAGVALPPADEQELAVAS